MAWTQSDLDTIRSHIASGIQSVRYADGRQVTYQSLDAMIAAEQRIAAAVGAAAPQRSNRRKLAAFSNGC